MTKFYEEYLRYKVNELKLFDENLKGELTIVISEKKKIKKGSILLSESDKSNIRKMIKKLSIKEIAPLRTSTSEIINLASIAAYSADVIDYKKN